MSRTRKLAVFVAAVAALSLGVGASPSFASTPTHTWATQRTDRYVPALKLKPGQVESNATAGTTLDSSNWSGYQLSVLGGASTPSAPSSPYTSVAGTWVVPTATQETAGQAEDGATWIGIGGGNDTADQPAGDPLLIQTGVGENVSSTGAASYYAWYEILPEPETDVSMPVHPGDVISASISSSLTDPGTWTVTQTDYTDGQSFTETVNYASAMDTAEWIVEAPTEISASSPGEATLPDLGVTEFSDAEVDGSPAPLSQGFTLDMEPSSTVIAAPSAPDSTGADFNDCSYPPANLSCTAPSGPIALPGSTTSSGGTPAVAYATDGPSLAAACQPLFTEAPGTSTYPPDAGQDYPQLDVVQADMHNTDSTLYVVLTIADMEQGATAVPPGGTANEYYLTFTYDGTEYFVNAEIGALGNTYTWGTDSATTGYTGEGTATGSVVDGEDGTITISAPLSDFANPGPGADLVGPASATGVLVGAPEANPSGVSGGLTVYAYKGGPGNDYYLGEICSTNGAPGSDGAAAAPGGGQVPEAPLAAVIPAAGLVVAGGVMVRRRRRSVAA